MSATMTLALAAFLAGGIMIWEGRWPEQKAVENVDGALPPRPEESSYVTSTACQTCHGDQHAAWHKSYHRTMTQAATPANILAPFDNVRLETEGQFARLYRDGDEFWVEMVDPEWERAAFLDGRDTRAVRQPPRVRARIVMTTGSHHFQAYWIRSQYGRELWQFPWRFHLGKRRWVHRKDVFLGPPEWRPGMHFKVWNDNCIFCHSTGGQPGLNPHTNYLDNTTVAELGIACEACHGPGREHVGRQKDLARRDTPSGPDPTIVNPARLAHDRASEICAACHAHFMQNDRALVTGPPFRPGDRLAQHGSFYRPEDEASDQITSRFWTDGTNRSGGREFMGMKESACYQKGELSCLSCHSMHDSAPNDQLARSMDGNDACYQCHQEHQERLSEHTHHAPDSTGSLCYNCHMPHTAYALFKAIRSHRIGIPKVTAVTHKAQPNACNLCHLDRSLQWTSDHLRRWYGTPSPELGADEHKVSAAALWLLRGDAGQRVVAAWHAGWEPARQASGKLWLAPILAPLLDDPYAAVRWLAASSLDSLPGFSEFDYEFDGPGPERQAASQRARQRWDEHTRRVPGSEITDGLRSLFGSAGEPNRDAIKQLIERRDDQPISSIE
jgi:predicted CXXCH cytochrome family protein